MHDKTVMEKMKFINQHGQQAKRANTEQIELSEDEVRMSAIQIFQEIVEPARSAREETEETKEEESK